MTAETPVKPPGNAPSAGAVLDVEAGTPSIFIAKARLLIQRERYPLALEELRKAIALDPDIAEAHALSAVCLVGMNEAREAETSAKEAVRLGPTNSFTHSVMAVVQSTLDRPRRALGSAREAVRLAPEESDLHRQLAAIQLELGKWRKARDAAAHALSLDPTNVDAWTVLAVALLRGGRRKEAEEAIRTALGRAPDEAYLHAAEGWLKLAFGHRRDAESSFREALRLKPTLQWAREGMVEVASSGMFGHAIDGAHLSLGLGAVLFAVFTGGAGAALILLAWYLRHVLYCFHRFLLCLQRRTRYLFTANEFRSAACTVGMVAGGLAIAIAGCVLVVERIISLGIVVALGAVVAGGLISLKPCKARTFLQFLGGAIVITATIGVATPQTASQISMGISGVLGLLGAPLVMAFGPRYSRD